MTLILPWAGWQYAQQMETTLRRGQEDALLTTARGAESRRRQRARASLPRSLICAASSIRRAATCSRRCSCTRAAARRLRRRMAATCASRTGLRRRRAGAKASNPRCASACIGARCTCTSRSRSRRCATKSRRAMRRAAAGRVRSRDRADARRIRPRARLVDQCDRAGPAARARLRDRRAVEALPQTKCRTSKACGAKPARAMRSSCAAPLNLFGTQLAVQALDASDAIVAQTRGLAWLHTGSEALKQRLEQYAPDGRARFRRRHTRLAAGARRLDRSHDADALSRAAARRRRLRALDLSRAVLAAMRHAPCPMAFRTACGVRRSMRRAMANAARSGSRSAGGEPSLVRAAVPIPLRRSEPRRAGRRTARRAAGAWCARLR